ncbi:unnamed protein product [Polarella glacialis]|uniref:Uncharacterized protein n=1 Tax=Polarella glacialis TaxID=89957 RepID=A0A813DC29_POLGL|nr:unnamed protein product [Polarella glacialis]
MGYRGVMPRALGLALLKSPLPTAGGDSEEEYATNREPVAASSEAARRRSRQSRLVPFVRVTAALVLVLRRVRAAYAERIAAWREMSSLTHCPALHVDAGPGPLIPAPPAAPPPPAPLLPASRDDAMRATSAA